MTRLWTAAFLIFLAGSIAVTRDALATEPVETDWVNYSEAANGDLYFYDAGRVEKAGAMRQVWNGIRYKTSLMGAFSFMSLLEIDCVGRTEKTLQSTFYSDKEWEQPAMKTDTTETAVRKIKAGSTTESLAEIVCE